MLKVLIIFSNPSDQTRLRLGKQDHVISTLSKRFGDRVSIERHHASEITDIHAFVTFNSFEVIQFSGHGDHCGIYLEKSSSYGDSELVAADQLLCLIDLAERPPRLAIFFSCYSDESIKLLSQAAPFVITADAQVGDAECTEFICGFYEWLFSGFSITLSFNHAIHLLQAKGLKSDNFKLSRRGWVTKGNTIYVRCSPQNHRDSILVNLDGVSHKLDYMGMEKEELLHLIARKLAVHYWIFDGARDDAIIPIGNLLFGSFSWKNSADIVYCTDLMRLAPKVSETHWKLWAALLISYNDLASSKYRSLQYPADPNNSKELQEAVSIFEYHIEKYLLNNVGTLKNLGFDNVLPQIAFVEAECTQAIDQMAFKRYSRVVTALESALTHYHEVVTATMPPSAVGEIPLEESALTQQPAPGVFISYSHDTVEHQERVLGLADRLRADGVDAEIDQYNTAPPEGWPLWCEQQIAAADVVLMICTETYQRRVSGNEERGQGLGVVWEARIIRQLLYDAGAIGNKFVPVLFSDASPEQIPTPIKGWTYYVVDTENGYEDLYRRLTGQPGLVRPALGRIRALPPRYRQWPEGTMREATASAPPSTSTRV